MILRPQDCKFFSGCNAPICPLDPRVMQSAHLRGEAVCFYLRASGKAGARESLAADPVFSKALEMLPAISARYGAVRRAIAQAANRPLKAFKGVLQRDKATGE